MNAGSPPSPHTRSELNAQFSPDGFRVVFESMRSGTQELWEADRTDGTGLDLSPDERTLLFAQMDAFTEDLMLVDFR